MHTYILLKDAWLYGRFWREGSRIELSARQAKYALLSGTIRRAD